MEIGQQIKKKRQELNMTQEELAEKLNVSRSTVSNWEIERNYPDIQLIVSISNILDISLEELLRKDSNVVKNISNDTHTKQKSEKKIKFLYFVIAAIILIGIIMFYAMHHDTQIDSAKQISDIKVTEDNITVIVDLPFYKSVNGYYMDNSPTENNAAAITISTCIDLSMSNRQSITIDKSNMPVKNVDLLYFVDDSSSAPFYECNIAEADRSKQNPK